MPKKSNVVTKSLRIDTLRNIFRRWGRLGKNQIDELMSSTLDIDREAVARTLYRDLEELVNNHEVNVHYFYPDGTPIEEFDPEIHKNRICEWSPVGNSDQIRGQDILSKNGALLLASDRLKGDMIQIESGNCTLDTGSVRIFFNIPNHFLCLKISNECLPVKVVFGRLAPNELNANSVFKLIEEKYGKRTILLSLPYAPISSFHAQSGKVGHTLVEVPTYDSSVNIKDLGSKNKSFYQEINPSQQAAIIRERNGAAEKTLSKDVGSFMHGGTIASIAEVIESRTVSRPFQLFLSDQIPVIII